MVAGLLVAAENEDDGFGGNGRDGGPARLALLVVATPPMVLVGDGAGGGRCAGLMVVVDAGIDADDVDAPLAAINVLVNDTRR